MAFLPVNKQDMEARGWEQCDFVCVTGDAYVDHPSFGTAIITRVLEAAGFRVGVIAQPDFRDGRDVARLGRPRLGFLVNSGNIDSMVAHYTAAKRRRSQDAYTPGNRAGARPDRAVEVYCHLLRRAFPDSIIIIGGVEASLRRFAHYDYWDDAVRESILCSSGADLLIYGMGENAVLEIAQRLDEGAALKDMRGIRGICYLDDGADLPAGNVTVASFEKVRQDKAAYAKAHKAQMLEQDSAYGRPLVQRHGERYVVQTPPQPVLTTEQLDRVFSLPYERYYHPSYEALGGVKAIEEVEFSIMHNRGCFGNCNFCSIAYHQGRQIAVRSHESVLKEAEGFVKNPRFKGYIHDVGGPTADFRHPSCQGQLEHGLCKGRKCLAPVPCKQVDPDHSDYLRLLRELRAIKGVKKVFVRSGLRFDYILLERDRAFLEELIEHHVSGQLKVAPEHCSDHVLDKMGKPHIATYERFEKEFYRITKKVGKEQYLVPYLMSSHPGSRLQDAVDLALFLRRHRMRPEQVQDFYPTPGTTSTCMYYTGLDPMSGEAVYVPRTPQEKRQQRALLQYFKPENRRTVIEALVSIRREDLIGRGLDCLVEPDAQYTREHRAAPVKAQGRQRQRGKRPVQKPRRSNKAKRGR